MEHDEYAKMFAAEDHYWWFVARRNLALTLLDSESDPVLDFGCGTGVALSKLQSLGVAIGLDRSEEALKFCRQRGLHQLVLADGTKIPLATDQIASAIALDIFEHIAEVELALAEVQRVLKPGGRLVLSVPAFQWLWGPHDVALMHQRRYTKSLMRQQLVVAGFEVEKLSYSVFFLFPVVVLVRILDRFRKGPAKVSLPKVPEWLNKILIGLQALETPLIKTTGLPWGSSVVAIARKPKSEVP